jgi:uncharacterized protein (DUF934 family)
MKFIDAFKDPWRTVGGEDGPVSHPVAAPHRLLTLAQWHAVRDTWPQNLPTGVSLPNDADLDDVAVDLPRLALIALHFPKWTDGRAYSQGRLLRSRYRFAGEIRATGEVVVDMMPLLARTGFDAVALRGDQKQSLAEHALQFFTAAGHYQGDVAHPQPRFARSTTP